MKKILLISHSEICYNARLLKAADYFHAKGWEVTVFNPVVGLASEETYRDFLATRSWRVIENDISKRSVNSYFNWFLVSVAHVFVRFTVEKLNLNLWSDYYLNKGLLFAPNMGANYSIVLVHLIDNLSFAMRFKRKDGTKVIYDSQEYFVGQYDAFSPKHSKWVRKNEKENIHSVDYLLTTTEVMRKRLLADYNFVNPSYRVRNVPTSQQSNLQYNASPVVGKELKIVWHGMGVFLENRRGLHIVLEAIALCQSNVKLYFQGNISPPQMELLKQYLDRLQIAEKVAIVPPANPDQIVESLKKYDIGVTGELPEEDNQRLTSSNKLFDYIHAGLAIISSNTLGLAETINEFNVGLLYEPGAAEELSKQIDYLADNESILAGFKQSSIKAAETLFWEQEYDQLIQHL